MNTTPGVPPGDSWDFSPGPNPFSPGPNPLVGLNSRLGISAERTLIVGVLNVTPDSFSDGGQFFSPAAAIQQGLQLHCAGADLVDVGGESTRPGSQRIPVDEELHRVIPVISGLAEAGLLVSVDTTRAIVARAAVAAGAAVINDVSGGFADPEMGPTVAELGVPYVVMHSRGPAENIPAYSCESGITTEVLAELKTRVDALLAVGVQPDQLILDPGLGFSKTTAQNWQLLADLPRFLSVGFPVLVGASRKRFLGELLADSAGAQPLPALRDAATAAISALVAAAGAWAVRVHEVPANADAIRVAAALRRVTPSAPHPGGRPAGPAVGPAVGPALGPALSRDGGGKPAGAHPAVGPALSRDGAHPAVVPAGPALSRDGGGRDGGG